MLGGEYTEKVDIWSCGVILYVLLCGYPPFNGNSNQEILFSVKRGTLKFDENDWAEISPEARDLIEKMICYDAAQRLSATEALAHSWFSKNHQHKEVDPERAKSVLNRLKRFQVLS
jgi:calcium-dependent protein kinase